MMTTDCIKRAEFEIKTHKGQCAIVCELRRGNGPRTSIDMEIIEEPVELSITATVTEYGRGQSAGQCVEAVRKIAKEHDLYDLDELCDIWDRWHLNGLKAGNRAQQEALEGFVGDYDAKCKHLSSLDLLIHHNYKYGTQWLFEPLPDDVWDVIEAAKEECEDFEDDVLSEDEMAEELADKLHGIDAEDLKALAENLGCDLEDAAKYHEENYQGQFASDAEFAEEFADQIGAINEDNSWPNNYIDWEAAARDLMMDYFEINGHYYRSA